MEQSEYTPGASACQERSGGPKRFRPGYKDRIRLGDSTVGAGPCACPSDAEGGHGEPPLQDRKFLINREIETAPPS